MQVNAVGYSTADCVGLASIAVTWGTRNRLTDASILATWQDASQAPEDGQTTTIDLTDISGTVVHSYADLTGTEHHVDPADFGALAEGYISVRAMRDGYASLDAWAVHVTLDNIRYLEDGSTARLLEDGPTERTLE